MNMTPEQVLKISKGDTEIAAFISLLLAENQRLTDIVEQQAKRIQFLENRVKELERQLGQTSRSSSKPHSSDGSRKPKNSLTRGGKMGAPMGHR